MSAANEPQYLATARLALPGGLVEIDEKFTSDLVPGQFWKPINKEAKAAVKARDAAEPVVFVAGDGERVAELEKALSAAEARIGELQGEVEELTKPKPDETPAA